MATVTIGLLGHTSINTAESVTNWSTFDTLDTDIKKEGSNGITGTFRSDGTSGDYAHGSAPATAVNKHVRMWVNTTSVPYLDTTANGGMEFWMNDGTTTEYYTIFSKDDYYGGWFNMVVDCDLFTTLTLANVEQWGLRVQYTSSAKNVDNVWVDYLRYLDGYYVTGGTSGDEITLEAIATADRGTTTLYGYGILEESRGAYFAYGELQLGNGTTTTFFKMDGDVLIFTDQPVADGLYAINGNGSGANINITGSTIKADGTASATQFDFDMSTGSPGTVSITDNVFQRGGAFTFTTGQTITGNSFTGCEQITPAGADMDGCSVQGYEGTTDTSALIWNVATDPNGLLDNMSFTKGTASTHAIEFGTSSPLTMTLTNVDFSGYNASDAQTDSALHIKRTSGTVTINISGGTTPSYKSDGATVVISANPTTVTGKVTTETGTDIQSANVFVATTATASGGLPFEQAVTSITRSGTTATATFTAAHNLKTNDKIFFEGITDKIEDNKRAIQVTVSSTTVVTFTTTDSGSTAYTGTITGTFIVLKGVSDVNGEIALSRVFPADQSIGGWARKSSSAPYYKQGAMTGAISTSSNVTLSAVLVED